uniref:Suppressor of cancer cell invasion variant 3 n=3 Tax=Murinae TaxID=39107 RepID=A0A7G3W5S4_RAT|nr:suppressor of cancer cell invasion variant 3 [Rattus norvegicus]
MVRGARQSQQPRSRLAPRLSGTVEKPPRKRKSRFLKQLLSDTGDEEILK